MQLADLPRLIEHLTAADRARAERLLHISVETGQLVAPPSMHEWVVDHFGSVAAVETQSTIRITNLVTYECAVFNSLRALRPIEADPQTDLAGLIAATGDPFCHPTDETPADTFGRVRGDYCVTASNIAKYGAHHAVVIFDEHHPLHLSRDATRDVIDVAMTWAEQAYKTDPEARYVFFMWNCLWKAGASIVHGHAQVTAIPGMHFGKIELLRRQARAYLEHHGVDYFADLIALHRTLGLAIDVGDAVILPSLTPIKDQEVVLIAPELTSSLKNAIAHVLDRFVGPLGVESFNLAMYLPPLGPPDPAWEGFPCVVRIVDRGPIRLRTTDMGAMELYAASVVASDPFQMIDALSP